MIVWLDNLVMRLAENLISSSVPIKSGRDDDLLGQGVVITRRSAACFMRMPSKKQLLVFIPIIEHMYFFFFPIQFLTVYFRKTLLLRYCCCFLFSLLLFDVTRFRPSS